MAKEMENIGASVRARLLNLSKANGQSFNLVLTRFALERLLFRLERFAESCDELAVEGPHHGRER
ncbi:hypothetical protein ACSSVZ_004719 [Amorphus sp. MBR-141]